MEKYKCSVILCGPAVGKTYLANHDSRFVDIDQEKSKYKYGLDNCSIEELEKGKSNRGKVINTDSNKYAIELLEKTINSGKIALISYQEEILNDVINNKIKYCLVYANINLREEYISRMKKRGNEDTFINDMTNEEAWISFYEKNKNDLKPTYKIELKEKEYLSDIIEYFFD